jgi:hypothetical protein
MALWGIPFLLIGNYMVWGRFLADAWLKRRTYYAVTNRRVLVLQEDWKRKTSTTFLEAIPKIERQGRTTGILWFGPKCPVVAAKGKKTRDVSRFSHGDVPVFADIEDVDSVHRLIMGLREKEVRGSIYRPSLSYNFRSTAHMASAFDVFSLIRAAYDSSTAFPLPVSEAGEEVPVVSE